MKRLLLILFILSQIPALAQEKKFFDKMYFGGGFGLNFDKSYFSFNLTPYGAYKLTEKFSVGLGINYQYWNDKLYEVDANNFGGNIFSRYRLARQLFISAKLEFLSIEFVRNDKTSYREGFYNFPVGIGYVVPLSKYASFYLIGQYDLLYDTTTKNGAYNTPWILEGGFGVGF
ncbi:MAG: hypothetical protein HQ474_10780 [Flammeovirgaceae bacterium]|jgi:long-subunit fatty acid transport protein|nr:hypothetical protein [Flammeovirgaceae bacterium]|tara:strand:- start:38375 stop:38893 length:519 start_codon:yes stop_codon:yes gene_type:complete